MKFVEALCNRIFSKEQRREYSSFEEAEKASEGYGADTIFKKVCQSTLAVIKGEAMFERDSYLFYHKEINYNLMFYMQNIFIDDGYLSVLDVGGALGSTYLQHANILEKFISNWSVVEQEHYVDFGKESIQVDKLNFLKWSDLEIQRNYFNCVLISGALQYLGNDKEMIDRIIKLEAETIILERTVVSENEHFLVQYVHEPIYEASIPFKVFSRSLLIEMLESRQYHMVDEWHSLVDGDEYLGKNKIVYRSFVFKRDDQNL